MKQEIEKENKCLNKEESFSYDRKRIGK